MSRHGLTTVHLLVKLLFCAPIDSTAENCRNPSPRKSVKVSKPTSGIGRKFACIIQIYSDVFSNNQLFLASLIIQVFYLLIQACSCRNIKHSLSGGGKGMRGYDALDCTLISQGSAGHRLGRLSELCFLPDKVARFLFEFHAHDYKSLGLPVIPSSASSGTIHKLLKTPHVCLNN